MKIFTIILCFIAAPFISGAEEPLNLAPQYVEGKNYHYVAQLEMEVDQTVTAPQKIENTFRLVLGGEADVSVTKVYENQSADLRIRIVNPKLQLSVKNKEDSSQDMAFDSTQKEEAQGFFQLLNPVTHCLEGTEFIVTVDPGGQAVDFKEWESIKQKFNEEFNSTLPEAFKDNICSRINPQLLKQVFNSFTFYLPDHPVNKGDKWTGNGNFILIGNEGQWSIAESGGQTLTLKNEFPITEEKLKSMLPKSPFPMTIDNVSGGVLEVVTLEKGSHIMISNDFDFRVSANQKVDIPGQGEASATYNIKVNLSLKKQ